MNHTGQSETILPDLRDARIQELQRQVADLTARLGRSQDQTAHALANTDKAIAAAKEAIEQAQHWKALARPEEAKLSDVVKQVISSLYRVEVKTDDHYAYLGEVAYAVPVMHLVNMAVLTGAELPKELQMFRSPQEQS